MRHWTLNLSEPHKVRKERNGEFHEHQQLCCLAFIQPKQHLLDRFLPDYRFFLVSESKIKLIFL